MAMNQNLLIQVRNSLLNKKLYLDALYGLLSYTLALFLSWMLFAQQDFLYGVWHDVGGIKEGIEKYGPQNRNRLGFGDTTREERLQAFAAINTSIHNSGEGLRDIRYRVPNGKSSTLLTESEVIHLQDVANLIDFLKWVVFVAVLIWGGWTFWGIKSGRYVFSPAQQLKGVFVFLFLATCLILAIGAERVFNTLHEWVFPKNNQWFFYYQDSLMSTMMLAPKLFAYIAVELVLLSLPFFVGLQYGVAKLSKAKSKDRKAAKG